MPRSRIDWAGRNPCPDTLARQAGQLGAPRRPFAHTGRHACMYYRGHPGAHKCLCNTRWISEEEVADAT